MVVTASRLFPNSYRDSVELMQIAATIEGLEGIERAGLVMATPANREVLAAAGLLTEAAAAAGPNDLVVSVAAADDAAAAQAFDTAAARLSGAGESSGGAASGEAAAAQTIAEAVAELDGANIALIATPGEYATAEALKALKRGLHVFLFSDNVPVADEIELKALAHRKGLLVMGPDCGTAIVDGIPLGFANVVRRGTIGLAAASGTGLQQVTSLIDRGGAGVSQAIGVGGRDLDERVGGRMMLDAIARLSEDDATDVIVLISKPPAEGVMGVVLDAAAAAGKPVVVNFLGAEPEKVLAAGALPAATFDEAARIAVGLALGTTADAAEALRSAADEPGRGDGPDLEGFAAGQTRIRGLYSGGSLAGEAKLVLKSELGAALAAAHEILDLGDDEYTVGRPHPMIDPRLRSEFIEATALDPSVALLLLDVVLGHGANADPAGVLVASIQAARATAATHGRRLDVVASVCGTEGDPQGLAGQEATLRSAGVVLASSNARAALIAARLAGRLASVPTGGGG